MQVWLTDSEFCQLVRRYVGGDGGFSDVETFYSDAREEGRRILRRLNPARDPRNLDVEAALRRLSRALGRATPNDRAFVTLCCVYGLPRHLAGTIAGIPPESFPSALDGLRRQALGDQ